MEKSSDQEVDYLTKQGVNFSNALHFSVAYMPMVFLYDSSDTDPIGEAIAMTFDTVPYRVYCPSIPGTVAQEKQVQFLKTFLKSKQLSDVILIGFGHHATVSLLCALQHSNLIKALMLVELKDETTMRQQLEVLKRDSLHGVFGMPPLHNKAVSTWSLTKIPMLFIQPMHRDDIRWSELEHIQALFAHSRLLLYTDPQISMSAKAQYYTAIIKEFMREKHIANA